MTERKQSHTTPVLGYNLEEYIRDCTFTPETSRKVFFDTHFKDRIIAVEGIISSRGRADIRLAPRSLPQQQETIVVFKYTSAVFQSYAPNTDDWLILYGKIRSWGFIFLFFSSEFFFVFSIISS
jgi:hypothetical protein